MAIDTSPIMHPPLQRRSQVTLDRIEQASFALLANGGWDAVTVNGIGRATGVSRGAFYARFPSRAALVEFVRTRYYSALSAAEHQAFAHIDPGHTADLRTVVAGAVAAVADVVREFGPIMVILRDDPAERETSGVARSILFDRYSRALLAAAAEIAHPVPAVPVAFTFRIVFETLAFSAHDPESVPEPLRLAPEQLRAELAAVVVAYLTAPPEAARGMPAGASGTPRPSAAPPAVPPAAPPHPHAPSKETP